MPQQNLLHDQWIAQGHAVVWRLEWDCGKVVSHSGRARTHVDRDRDIEFLRQLPIRVQARVVRGYTRVLRRQFSECPDSTRLNLRSQPVYVRNGVGRIET